MSNETRAITEEESKQIAKYFANPVFDIMNNYFLVELGGNTIQSANGKYPWYYTFDDKKVSSDDLDNLFPKFDQLHDPDYIHLTGTYHDKSIRWSLSRNCWTYLNHQEVQFSDSESSSDSGKDAKDPPDEDSDQAEVSQLLDSTTQRVEALVTQLSQPSTPQTVPGGLPVTPAVLSTWSFLPTPTATTSAVQLPALPPSGVQTPTRSSRRQSTIASRSPSPGQQVPVPPRSPSHSPRRPSTVTSHRSSSPSPPNTPSSMHSMAGVGGGTPKLLGSAPEPYTGKRETVEAFWNTLENYFFINGDLFTDELKRVSSALTYFKIGTPASDWAQDRQKTCQVLV
jgi:hypothetical protein